MATGETQPFLKGTDVVSVNNSGAWGEILKKEKLSIPANSDKNIEINPINDIGVSKFTSDQNTLYFGPLDNASASNAAVGDSFGSAVLLAEQPKNLASLPLIEGIASSFDLEVGGSSSRPLPNFLGQLDKDKRLRATLVLQAQASEEKSPLILDSDTPTNAVWFIVKPGTYEVTYVLSYLVTGTNDFLDNAITWIKTNLDGFAPGKEQEVSAKETPEKGNFENEPPKKENPIHLTLKRTKRYRVEKAELKEPDVVTSISFAFDVTSFRLYLDLSTRDKEILLVPRKPKQILEMIKDIFKDNQDVGEQDIDMAMLPNGDNSDPFASIFDDVHLWYVRLRYDGLQPKKRRLQWGIGVFAFWKPKENLNIATLMTYDSMSKLFVGRLMFEQDFQTAMDVRLPTWDPRLSPSRILHAKNLKPEDFNRSLDLWTLVGLDPASQPPIPTKLRNVQVTFQGSSDPNTGSVFSFMSDLVRDDKPQPERPGGAPSGFSWDTASLDLVIVSPKVKGSTKTYSIDLYTTFTLTPPSNSSVLPATFAAGLSYKTNKQTGSSWLLQASAQNLSVGLLRSFFEIEDRPGAADGAMAVLDKLTLRNLDIMYTYQAGTASSFLMTGVLVLGMLELDMSFQYVSAKMKSGDVTAVGVYANENPDDGKLPADPSARRVTAKGGKDTFVKFVATLRLSSPGATIASVAESIVPGARDSLPAWIGDIVVNPENAMGVTYPTAELEWNIGNNGAGDTSILTLWVSIAGFNFTFVQYKAIAPKIGANSAIPLTKRIVRIGVDQIPLMKDIPLVGQLPQPFDSLEYLWVDDETLKPEGITRQELDLINSKIPQDIPPFQTKKAKVEEKPGFIVLPAGHHFVVITKQQVVLDHVFNTSRKETEDPEKSAALIGAGLGTAPPSAHIPATIKAPATPEPTKGNLESKAGPLSISALTLEYKSNALIITVDATLALGPISFSVIGFEIKVQLSRINLDNLAAIITDNLISISLHGIAVGVAKGPLTLKGVFMHDEDPVMEKYSGGIAVGFKVWQVLAVGQYTKKKPTNDDNGFRSVFVYGKLDGPLVQLEFATISGVRLGFGYNYSVRMPLINELHDFPFISDDATAGAKNDPYEVLKKMVGSNKPFVFPKEGSYWFCAGMTISAFEVLTITAVLMMDIDTGKSDPNDAGITIALLGDGIFQMPPEADPQFTLFYVELIVSVELNFVSGYIAANAVLAPASHVYVPMAHLVGGASFYSWFGNNSHAGDWVISIGGFPRGYAVPAHYPNPDRIGLNFTLGDCIHVLGEAYLAVTPKCAMVGGRLHMALDVGPVSAYVDVVFDAFLNLKPFYFKARLAVSVGVECSIDILFIHIHISIHLGADLTIWGPDAFGGYAWVDFWFFGFGIDFGDKEKNLSAAMSLDEFYKQVITAGPATAPPTNDKSGTNAASTTQQHKYSIEDGLIPAKTPAAENDDSFPSTGAASVWQVKAGTLKFRIDTPFPLSDAHFQPLRPTDPVTAIKIPSANVNAPDQHPGVPKIFSWPMHSKPSNPITSSLEISVFQIDNPANPILQHGFRGELVLKSAPVSMWSEYDWRKDPLLVNMPGHLRNAENSTVDLVLGVRILPPLPRLYPSKIVDFDASAAMRSTLTVDSTPIKIEHEQGSLFSGGYYKPDVEDEDVDAQKKRWAAFGAAWSPPVSAKPAPVPASTTTVDPPKAMTLSDLRSAMVNQIAFTLEWNIRPSDEMAGNVSIPVDAHVMSPSVTTKASVEAASQVVDVGTQLLRIEKLPQLGADDRFEWDLQADPPTSLASEIDVYYPQLPFVCGTPFVAAS